MTDDAQSEGNIHERLLAGDPTAPEELARKYLPAIQRHVAARAHNHGIHDRDLINDATVDAVFGYIRHPEQFNPQKSNLLPYLKFSAERDLINAVAKDRRHKRGEELSDDVELVVTHRNKPTGVETTRRGVEAEAIASIDGRHEIDSVMEWFPEPRDRSLLTLMANGERKTSKFAAILGINGLPANEQRHVVKQHKDRLKQQLKRGRKKNG
jgi:hypothetical protein